MITGRALSRFLRPSRPRNQKSYRPRQRRDTGDVRYGFTTDRGIEYTAEQTGWLRAISSYQACHGRFKNMNDPRILQIAKSLGYHKVTTDAGAVSAATIIPRSA